MNIGSIADFSIEIVGKVRRGKSAERRSCVNVDWNVFVLLLLNDICHVQRSIKQTSSAAPSFTYSMRMNTRELPMPIYYAQLCSQFVIIIVSDQWWMLLVRLPTLTCATEFSHQFTWTFARAGHCETEKTSNVAMFNLYSVDFSSASSSSAFFLSFSNKTTTTSMNRNDDDEEKKKKKKKKSRQRQEQKGKEQKRSLFVYLVSTQIIIISGKTSRLLSLSHWLSSCLNRKISSVWPLQLEKRNNDDDERRNRSIGSERLWARRCTH